MKKTSKNFQILRAAISKQDIDFDVSGNSMLPFIKNNSRIKLAPAYDYSLGDIIAFESGGKLIIHRIVALSPEIITKGDFNLKFDAPVSRGMILGKKIEKSSISKAINFSIAAISALIGIVYCHIYKRFFRKDVVFADAR